MGVHIGIPPHYILTTLVSPTPDFLSSLTTSACLKTYTCHQRTDIRSAHEPQALSRSARTLSDVYATQGSLATWPGHSSFQSHHRSPHHHRRLPPPLPLHQHLRPSFILRCQSPKYRATHTVPELHGGGEKPANNARDLTEQTSCNSKGMEDPADIYKNSRAWPRRLIVLGINDDWRRHMPEIVVVELLARRLRNAWAALSVSGARLVEPAIETLCDLRCKWNPRLCAACKVKVFEAATVS